MFFVLLMLIAPAYQRYRTDRLEESADCVDVVSANPTRPVMSQDL
jgi:hypothetical protein